MKYKFILVDDVFLWNMHDRALFYNAESFSYMIVEKNTDVKQYICNQLANPANLNSIVVGNDITSEEEELLSSLLEKGIARTSNNIEDCAIPPRVIINGDLEYMGVRERWEYISGKNLYNYLSNITFYVSDDGLGDINKDIEKLIADVSSRNENVKFNIVSRIDNKKGKTEIEDEFREVLESEILSAHLDKRRIFIHQKINVNYWGQLYIFPNGNIYPLPYETPDSILGHIGEPLLPMIAKELVENHAWRKVRDMAPCNGCIFQWLCPSPSYMEMTGKTRTICGAKLLHSV